MPLIGARGVSDQSCVRLKLDRETYLSVKLTSLASFQLSNEGTFTFTAAASIILSILSRCMIRVVFQMRVELTEKPSGVWCAVHLSYI